MFKCLDCGEVFEETGVKVEPESYEYWGAPFSHDHHYQCCPACGSEDFEETEDPEDDLG